MCIYWVDRLPRSGSSFDFTRIMTTTMLSNTILSQPQGMVLDLGAHIGLLDESIDLCFAKLSLVTGKDRGKLQDEIDSIEDEEEEEEEDKDLGTEVIPP